MSTANEALDHARHIITGARRGTHGEPERCFDTIAAMWAAYLGVPVSPAQVCRMMVLLKVARAANGADPDHDIDAVGYAALAAEMQENQDSDGKSMVHCVKDKA